MSEPISRKIMTMIRKRLDKEAQDKNLRLTHLETLKSRTKYELMYESFHIANLFYEMNQTLKHSKDSVFYMISTSWFNRWKKYVNFDHYINNNLDKFLKLNMLPLRSETSQKENYLTHLDENIKKDLNKYFDSYFIADHSDFYPGFVSNKELIYDKVSVYMNLEKQSSLNYNMLDNLVNGKDYFIVTRDIWKYFQVVYGGQEIKRYRVGSSPSTKNEVYIESKLKSLNVIIIKPKPQEILNSNSNSNNNNHNNDVNVHPFPFIIDKPKFVFTSRKNTLNELKKQFIDMFLMLRYISEKDLRFWILDPNYSYDSFVKMVDEKYTKSHPRVILPGFCLDLLNQRVKLEEIDDMLNNRIIVMEYIDPSHEHFPFKTQHLSDFSSAFQDDIRNRSNGKNKTRIDMDTLYDKIIFNDPKDIQLNPPQTSTSSTLFSIKKFFSNKYMLDQICKVPSDELKTIFLRICDKDNANDKEAFEEEIQCLKENMDLIFDKSELLLKLDYAYSNNFERVNKSKAQSVGEGEPVKLRQDLILKKRERSKLMVRLKAKKEAERKMTNINIKEESEKEIPLKEEEEEEEEKCAYCGKPIEEEEFIMCESCKKVKYCNSYCLNKDLRFHNKKCNLLKENENEGKRLIN